MSAFNSYNAIMGTAEVEAGIAAFILPPATMVGFQFKLSKGNPVNLEKAGQAWGEAADAIEQTKTTLQEKVSAISAADWTAEDRTSYEAKVEEFIAQLDCLQTYCQAVGIALIAYAWALMVYAVFAVAIGTYLAVLAAAAAAAMVGVVTAGVALKCQALAATCLTVTMVATGILAGASQIAAVVFQGGALATALAESANGNEQAMSNFQDAQVTGSAAALANLGQNAINGGLAYAGARGRTSPVSGVDLDADRNANNTWTVGGGATYKTESGHSITGGGHIKWGDEGFAGGDLNGGVKTPQGYEVKGNIGYTDEDGIGQGERGTITGGGSVGYSAPIPTASSGGETPDHTYGGAASGTHTHNFETGESTTTRDLSGQVNGGDIIKPGMTQKTDGEGNAHDFGSVATPIGTFKGDETPPWDK